MLLLEIFFWIAFILIAHSYLLYPIFTQLLGRFFNNNSIVYSSEEEFPMVSILMAAHNEEQVIEEKIFSILNSNYPSSKIEILIGSDCSTDKTNAIIKKYTDSDKRFHLFEFYNRTGKINIVNHLNQKAKGEILLLTDANVILEPSTLFELVKHFKNPDISLVDSFMKHRNLKANGISHQESNYISSEVKTKHAEGKIWGSLMGPFGGCFAIRRVDFQPVPNNFLVDDFYSCMQVLKNKKHCISDEKAIVLEDVSNNLRAEFKRKIRISSGNFQNLAKFWPLLLRFNGTTFAFFSHKVLRWLTPFLILFILLVFPFLLAIKEDYKYFGLFLLIIFSFLGFDFLLKKLNIHIRILRFLTHFTTMNIALFIGFFRYIKGIKSNVWEPTKRNQ
jgi:cellulose synthase/poly-beta-1,6-N-acetylglucosamine synthase-like glycosyltransferase